MKLLLCIILVIYTTTSLAQSILPFTNPGKNINSKYNEINPIISPDGKTLYFIRCNSPDNTFGEAGSQDIWYSELGKDSTWNPAIKMSPPFNSDRYNGVINVTPDGNTLLIRGAFEKGKYVGIGYSFSHKIISGWSFPEKVKIKKYSTLDVGYSNSAFLSNDGKTLLLSFSEELGGEANDIYVSFLQDENNWSKPKSLGKNINTEFNEASPFLAADGVTLYFTSDRPGGLGQSDIYMCKRANDSWEKWTELKNLGNSINTDSSEAYYSLDAAGKFAYMVSEKNSLGEADIVQIKLQEDIKPNPVVLIYGHVYNLKTNEPVGASISYEILADSSKPAGIASSDPNNGEYKIVLPYGQRYGFVAQAPGFMSVSDNIDLRDVAEYKEIKRDLYLVPIEIGQTVRLQNIFFDYAKSDLRPESFPELDRVVKLLSQNPNMKIEVSGHTDNAGSDEFNIKLSQNRANSVKNYIVSKNILTGRVSAKGYGKTKPIASNDTEEERQINRRVEFTVLSK